MMKFKYLIVPLKCYLHLVIQQVTFPTMEIINYLWRSYLLLASRIFEGTSDMMYHFIKKCAALPEETEIYCGHEYTLSNLKFAKKIEPDNNDIQEKITEVKQLLSQNKASLPSTIGTELKINPFMRCHEESVKKAAEEYAQRELLSPEKVSVLRHWKNTF